MQKNTANKFTIAAVSIAAAASFGAGAAALAQGGNEFNPAYFDSAYTRGSDGAGEGYRANQTSVDAEANRQSDDGKDADKTAGNQGIDDAFSQMPIDGESGTMAYNFTDNSSTGVLVSTGGNANAAANGEGLSAGAIIGDGGNSGSSAGGSTAGDNNGNGGNSGNNGGNTGGADTPTAPTSIVPNVVETANSKQPTSLGDPAIAVTGDNRELSSFTESDVESPDNPDGAVTVIIRKDETSDYPLYVGQKLDAWAVFCALDAQILFTNQDGKMRVYGWGCTRKEFEEASGVVSSTFEVLDYPTIATPEMEIKVRYRFNSTGNWIYQTISYQAEESRYYITSEAKSDGSSPDFAMQPNQRYKLYYYAANAMCTKEGEPISRLYTAWFDNGEEIEDPYNYEYTLGRHVIYPGKFVTLPDYWDVSFEVWWLNDDISQLTESKTEGKYLCYLQTLKGTGAGRMSYTTFAPDGKSTLRVPYGIQMIQAGLNGIAADTLVVPSSVLRIDGTTPTMQVRDAYQVSSDNQVYASTKDGILTTKDGSRYCGIPTKMTSLDVPEKVAKVDLPAVNSLSSITLHANTVDELPKLDLENLDDCVIVVNDNVFEDFVARRYYQLVDTNLTVAKASEPDVRYHVSNGMIYSETDLIHVMDAGQSSIELKVPHTIKTGAFDSCNDVDTITLGDEQDYIFEDGCLNEGVGLIVCKTKAQYDYVASRIVDAGAPYASVALSQSNKSGFVWYTYTTPFGDECTTLEKAPADLVEFDGCVVPDDDPDGCLWIDSIGSSAFSDCQSLRWVTLPESVERIGSSAFSGCKNLEGVLINNPDTIVGEAYAFKNCPSLRFIASNAQAGYFVTDERTDNCVMYAPTGCEGYDWRFVAFDEKSNVKGFTMVDIGGGAKALYGIGDTWLGTVPWIVLGASSNLPAKVELPNTTMQFFSGSFSHISTPFEVNWDDLPNLQTISSYQYFSGTTPAQSFTYAGAFQYSNLIGDVHLGVSDELGFNFIVGESAFGGCNISSLSVSSASAQLYAAAFEDCTKLSSATIDSNYGDVYANAFFGCTSLTDVTFGGYNPITFATFKSGDGYEFKLLGMDTPQDEAEQLHFHVPEGREEAYLEQWAYRYAGYLDYDDMFSDVQTKLLFDTGSMPSDAQVVSAMVEKLTVAENTLRKMMGLDSVKTTTVVAADSDTGCVFKKVGAVNTLVSIATDKEVVDLDEIIPDSMTDVQVATNAFENCPNLKRVISSSKVSGLDSGVFSGLESVTLEVPSLDAAPMLLQGSADMPYMFGFGTQLSLDIPEAIRSTLLRDWTYQAYGIMEEFGSPFFSSSMNNFILWYCYDWNPETTQADLDDKINSQFAAFENQLRIALGLDEVTDYAKLASYVSTIDYFDIANSFGAFAAVDNGPASMKVESSDEGKTAEAQTQSGEAAGDDSGGKEVSPTDDAHGETLTAESAVVRSNIASGEKAESVLHQE